MSQTMDQLILMYILMLALYIPFLLIYRKRLDYRKGRSKFYKGVISILENCQINAECVPQVNLLYKRIAEQYNSVSEKLRSSTELLEDYICTLDTLDESQFKSSIGFIKPLNVRNRLIAILNIQKTMQPFSSLSSKESNIMNMLKHAIDTKNNDLANNSLNQLADEIEILEGNLRTQTQRNKTSFLISTIGVILTLFFGMISFIQFINK